MTRPPAPRRPALTRLRLFAPVCLALGLSAGCSKVTSTASTRALMADAPAELPAAPVIDPIAASADDADYDVAEDPGYEDRPTIGAAERSVVAMGGAQANYGGDALSPPARDAKGKKNEAAKQAEAAHQAKAKQGEDQAPDHGRQIIYVAGLQVSVFDLENAMAMVEALPDRYGGWVHMRTPNQVVLRLPAPILKPVMAEVAELGVVEARTLNAQDVSAEYVDLESRIKVLRETQAQLLELLGQAKTVEEALHVRNALDNVTMELEVALGRMRQLDDLIAFSTLTITLVERGPQDRLPTHNDPFSWVDRLGVEATEWR